MKESSAFDAKGEPTLLKEGLYRVENDFDKWGRKTETRFFNLAGGAATYQSWGAHRVAWNYDEHGNGTSIKLFNFAGAAIKAGANLFDFPAHEQRLSYDQQNRPVTYAYYDQDGRPITGSEGWHLVRFEYDEKGYVSAISYFDDTDKPVNLQPDGYHRWQSVNDEFGQPLEKRFFDATGKAVTLRNGGYHLRKNEYDKSGNQTVQSYFDVDGNPVADQTDGAHRYIQHFDRFRNPVLTLYFDEAGKPIDNTSGFHKKVSSYDEYGSNTDTRWFAKDGQPVNGPDGVHRISYEYNERGLLTRIVQYSADGGPAVDKQGIHKILFVWNDKRQRTKWQAFGLKNEPAEDKDGNHIVLNEFDERGREIRVTQLRADGSPNWIRELGIATRRQVYDKENNWIKQAYYDDKDRLVSGLYGHAKGTWLIETDGRKVLTWYDSDGQPWFNPLYGYAIKKTDSRRRGDSVDSFYGADGDLIAGPEDWAERRRNWSDDGALLSEAYFGLDGIPVVGPGGYHRALHNSGEPVDKFHYFDTQNHELPPIGPEAFVSVIFVQNITNIYQPAFKARLQAGDIFWQYGTWSFPNAWKAERPRGTKLNEIAMAVWRKFTAERNRLSDRPVSMTVIRHGRPVKLTVPPLPEEMLGASVGFRIIPLALFESWKAAANNKN